MKIIIFLIFGIFAFQITGLFRDFPMTPIVAKAEGVAYITYGLDFYDFRYKITGKWYSCDIATLGKCDGLIYLLMCSVPLIIGDRRSDIYDLWIDNMAKVTNKDTTESVILYVTTSALKFYKDIGIWECGDTMNQKYQERDSVYGVEARRLHVENFFLNYAGTVLTFATLFEVDVDIKGWFTHRFFIYKLFLKGYSLKSIDIDKEQLILFTQRRLNQKSEEIVAVQMFVKSYCSLESFGVNCWRTCNENDRHYCDDRGRQICTVGWLAIGVPYILMVPTVDYRILIANNLIYMECIFLDPCFRKRDDPTKCDAADLCVPKDNVSYECVSSIRPVYVSQYTPDRSYKSNITSHVMFRNERIFCLFDNISFSEEVRNHTMAAWFLYNPEDPIARTYNIMENMITQTIYTPLYSKVHVSCIVDIFEGYILLAFKKTFQLHEIIIDFNITKSGQILETYVELLDILRCQPYPVNLPHVEIIFNLKSDNFFFRNYSYGFINKHTMRSGYITIPEHASFGEFIFSCAGILAGYNRPPFVRELYFTAMIRPFTYFEYLPKYKNIFFGREDVICSIKCRSRYDLLYFFSEGPQEKYDNHSYRLVTSRYIGSHYTLSCRIMIYNVGLVFTISKHIIIAKAPTHMCFPANALVYGSPILCGHDGYPEESISYVQIMYHQVSDRHIISLSQYKWIRIPFHAKIDHVMLYCNVTYRNPNNKFDYNVISGRLKIKNLVETKVKKTYMLEKCNSFLPTELQPEVTVDNENYIFYNRVIQMKPDLKIYFMHGVYMFMWITLLIMLSTVHLFAVIMSRFFRGGDNVALNQYLTILKLVMKQRSLHCELEKYSFNILKKQYNKKEMDKFMEPYKKIKKKMDLNPTDFKASRQSFVALKKSLLLRGANYTPDKEQEYVNSIRQENYRKSIGKMIPKQQIKTWTFKQNYQTTPAYFAEFVQPQFYGYQYPIAQPEGYQHIVQPMNKTTSFPIGAPHVKPEQKSRKVSIVAVNPFHTPWKHDQKYNNR